MILLICAGCCVFYFCMGLFAKLYFGDEALKSIISGDLLGDALKGFKFDTSSNVPIVQRPQGQPKPNSFIDRKNFSVPGGVAYDIGDLQTGLTNAGCSEQCFKASNCSGYMIDDAGNCQLKGNVRLIFYDHGKSIKVSGDVGGTQFGVLPFEIIDPEQPYYWSNTVGLQDAVSNCYSDPKCLAFTYKDGIAKAYANVVAVDSGVVGNTYIKFDVMGRSDIAKKPSRYSDAPTGDDKGFHVDADKFKPADFVPPPAPPPAAPPSAYYANDLKYFKKWPRNDWNAGKDTRWQDPQEANALLAAAAAPGPAPPRIDSLEMCANVCMQSSKCMSIVWNNNSKTCYFRGDLSSDNTRRWVCSAQSIDEGTRDRNGCNGSEEVWQVNGRGAHAAECTAEDGVVHPVNDCWSINGSKSESGTESWFKMQDPLEITCPKRCADNANCKAGMFDGTDCTIYEFAPKTVDTNDRDFTTRWKFDYFPG